MFSAVVLGSPFSRGSALSARRAFRAPTRPRVVLSAVHTFGVASPCGPRRARGRRPARRRARCGLCTSPAGWQPSPFLRTPSGGCDPARGTRARGSDRRPGRRRRRCTARRLAQDLPRGAAGTFELVRRDIRARGDAWLRRGRLDACESVRGVRHGLGPRGDDVTAAIASTRASSCGACAVGARRAAFHLS